MSPFRKPGALAKGAGEPISAPTEGKTHANHDPEGR